MSCRVKLEIDANTHRFCKNELKHYSLFFFCRNYTAIAVKANITESESSSSQENWYVPFWKQTNKKTPKNFMFIILALLVMDYVDGTTRKVEYIKMLL